MDYINSSKKRTSKKIRKGWKMKFIVAIDWKAVKGGYTFLELGAKTETQAMIEATAVAFFYGAKIQYDNDTERTFQGIGDYAGMKDVWCLRLLKQTSSDAKKMEATLTHHIFYPDIYSWGNAEGGFIWSNIDPVNRKK